MKNAIESLKEEIGNALLPVVQKTATMIKDWAYENKDRIGDWAKSIVGHLQDIIGYLKNDFFGTWKVTFQSLGDIIEGFAGTFGKTMLKGISAGVISTAYFLSKGIIDALIGAAFDGTTFKDHIKNVIEYGWGTATSIFGNESDYASTWESVFGKIQKRWMQHDAKNRTFGGERGMPWFLRDALLTGLAPWAGYLFAPQGLVSQKMPAAATAAGKIKAVNFQGPGGIGFQHTPFLTMAPGARLDRTDKQIETNTKNSYKVLTKMLDYSRLHNDALNRIEATLAAGAMTLNPANL